MQATPTMVDDALRFMGVPKEARSGEMAERAYRTFELLEGFIRPRRVWGRFSVLADDRGIRLDEAVRIESGSLARLMAHSRECWVMAVTLGPEVDRRILLAQKQDMLDGMALDACASVRADVLCDEVEGEIFRELREGEHPTMRFSPGYGDAPLTASADLIALLDATRRIGLAMTRSYMMTPIKSVTALIGISDQNEDRTRDCSRCSAGPDCPYRKRGESCGG
ncbi:vitamin B12 dependent-methionine synthase activation domain-containing protein [uncultured Fretibacterium sp.]|uniref:vitamin B12 dependent-methionine synthase activation domain-containing protein n=1 Tax=uncultured Fretibacterium sp. TaxID=1678694 RepID=UPI00260DA266|nr:vitamin B12 dependent-methionine synthase activation domain-containing protein [uncultured Fretibacterium sp.]